MNVILLLEIIGTIAFAVSGALVAVEKKMDLFGVMLLGMTTAVGGGIVRDLLLGVTPPIALQNPLYAVVALLTSIVVFLPSVRSVMHCNQKIYDVGMLIMDSIGLGLFTVVGVQTAGLLDAGYNSFLAVFVGVITGVGGGVLRDLFAGDMPQILVKHFYACASLTGALVCILCWHAGGDTQGMLLGAVTTCVLRILAAHYHWSLPKAK
ncbi:MAG: trimeric intracellular cation channel family protein [Lachnospiraceae bacterium]|nr:trimeric intracellular cation channel family protein [Lachnospiraceae bacterium]